MIYTEDLLGVMIIFLEGCKDDVMVGPHLSIQPIMGELWEIMKVIESLSREEYFLGWEKEPLNNT